MRESEDGGTSAVSTARTICRRAVNHQCVSSSLAWIWNCADFKRVSLTHYCDPAPDCIAGCQRVTRPVPCVCETRPGGSSRQPDYNTWRAPGLPKIIGEI